MGRWDFFYHLLACRAKYVSENIYIYIFLKHTHRQTNAKETKEEKRKTKETKEAAILGLWMV